MTDSATPVTIHVTYTGTASTRFDRDYYTNTHRPLAIGAWHKLGLLSLHEFYPASAESGTIAVVELRFRDEAALAAALGSPDTASIMADIPNFTDAPATLTRATPL